MTKQLRRGSVPWALGSGPSALSLLALEVRAT